MITKETLVQGLMNYVDNEVLPGLSTSGKIITGTMICLASPRLTQAVTELSNNSMVQTLGIVDKDGRINSDALVEALKDNMNRFGKLELNVPMVGTLKFNSNDVERLRGYMV